MNPRLIALILGVGFLVFFYLGRLYFIVLNEIHYRDVVEPRMTGAKPRKGLDWVNIMLTLLFTPWNDSPWWKKKLK